MFYTRTHSRHHTERTRSPAAPAAPSTRPQASRQMRLPRTSHEPPPVRLESIVQSRRGAPTTHLMRRRCWWSVGCTCMCLAWVNTGFAGRAYEVREYHNIQCTIRYHITCYDPTLAHAHTQPFSYTLVHTPYELSF